MKTSKIVGLACALILSVSFGATANASSMKQHQKATKMMMHHGMMMHHHGMMHHRHGMMMMHHHHMHHMMHHHHMHHMMHKM